jgi:hypothetical protein
MPITLISFRMRTLWDERPMPSVDVAPAGCPPIADFLMFVSNFVINQP